MVVSKLEMGSEKSVVYISVVMIGWCLGMVWVSRLKSVNEYVVFKVNRVV